ncbi:MAG: hypothetical protein ABSF70_13975 [Terracidiphilus sp.]
MFLAYMDDYGTGDERQRFQVLTAVIIQDRWFYGTAALSVGVLSSCIPENKAEEFWDKFEEFKGHELFWGRFAKLANRLVLASSFHFFQATVSRCRMMRTNSRAIEAQVAISDDLRHSSST